ncbi:MAG: TonB-dependent receptor family protein [Oligoflexus sp.]
MEGKGALIGILLCGLAAPVSAAEEIETDKRVKESLDRIYIIGSPAKVRELPGSAHILTEVEIDRFKFTDLHRVLKQIPGVQIQEEDGYGLRPNIGLRGATPERSRKVMFYQDGLLLHPSAYSAPAAYYMPLSMRYQSVEVFKGASGIKYGPNSVGGAINFVTRPLREQRLIMLDLSAGSFDFTKTHLAYFDGADGWYWGLDGAMVETSGFKELPDSEQSTGFRRDDLMVKLGRDLGSKQRLELMLAWDQENSKETYLGLTQADFDQDPYQRYLASSDDEMKWKNRQLRISHFWELSNQLSLTTRAYQNDLHRNWGKLSGFVNGPSIKSVLADPTDERQRYYDILRGKANTSNPDDELKLGYNARSYQSQGLQIDGQWDHEFAEHLAMDLSFGLRFHQDFEERRQYEEFRSVVGGRLGASTRQRAGGTERKDESDAQAFYLQNRLKWKNLAAIIGVRQEEIKTKQTNFVSGKLVEGSESITVPGVGMVYEFIESWSALLGIHKGFSIGSPGQSALVEPEESVNFELGLRYRQENRYLDLIAFYNDYENIKGVCSVAGGCSLDNVGDEFDGGNALIQGAELSLGDQVSLSENLVLNLALNHTFTDATFTDENVSDNPEWGIGTIRSGDPLPYITRQQSNILLALQAERWSLQLLTSFYSKKYDQSVAEGRREVPGYEVIDLGARYFINPEIEFYANIDNALDEAYLASYRPDGLRPGKRRTFIFGTKLVH